MTTFSVEIYTETIAYIYWMCYCRFERFPYSLCDLTSLRFLDLSDNQIREVPENLSNLQQLESLLLFVNQLERLPNSICSLPVQRSRDRWRHMPSKGQVVIKSSRLPILTTVRFKSSTYGKHASLFNASPAVTRPIVAPTPSVRWAVCTFCGWATIDCARCRGASVSCASSTGVRVSTRCQPWSTVIQWSGPRWTSASAASMQSPSTSAPVTLATQTIRRRTLVDIADIVFGRPLGRVLARCVDRLSVVCNTCIVAKPYDVSGQRRYHWISRWRVPIGSHMSQSAAVWPQF